MYGSHSIRLLVQNWWKTLFFEFSTCSWPSWPFLGTLRLSWALQSFPGLSRALLDSPEPSGGNRSTPQVPRGANVHLRAPSALGGSGAPMDFADGVYWLVCEWLTWLIMAGWHWALGLYLNLGMGVSKYSRIQVPPHGHSIGPEETQVVGGAISPCIYLYIDSEYFTLLAPTFIMVDPINSNMTRFGRASPHRACYLIHMARYIPYRVLVTSLWQLWTRHLLTLTCFTDHCCSCACNRTLMKLTLAVVPTTLKLGHRALCDNLWGWIEPWPFLPLLFTSINSAHAVSLQLESNVA